MAAGSLLIGAHGSMRKSYCSSKWSIWAPKRYVALAQILDVAAERDCAPGEPVCHRLFKVFEISAMDDGRLMSLDAAENFPRICPEAGV